jgi:hypothetical protein
LIDALSKATNRDNELLLHHYKNIHE